MTEYFIDCHCHLFNIEDIPLYPTITNVEHLPNSLLALGFLINYDKKLLKKHKAFIDFFDRQRSENTKWLVEQVEEGINSFDLFSGRKIIITPLIMDFDRVGSGGSKSWENITYQTERLCDGIKKSGISELVRVLPFIGIDLRKVIECDNVKNLLKSIEKEVGGIKPVKNGVVSNELKSGQIIGIKLYPPMGFNPFNQEKGTSFIDPKLKEFYEICIARGIPVTTHCQKGSYSGSENTKKKVIEFTHPNNWKKVLESIDGDELRLNLAHFGGEKEIFNTVFPNMDFEYNETKKAEPRKKFSKGGWMQTMLYLLKKYKHTYADISAFDYTNRDACLALAWLLVLDESGKLNSRICNDTLKYKLKDKLLWGSDIPMILEKSLKSGTYNSYLQQFIKTMDIAQIKGHHSYTVPKKNKYTIPDTNDLIDRITCKNPMKFLFG